MRYRPSDLIPREQQRVPFLSLFIDIAALLFIGGISTRGLWMLFPTPAPEPPPEPVPEKRAARSERGYLKLPDIGTQMQGLAGLIQQGTLDEATPLYLGAILTQLADARTRGESPEQFLATGFRDAGLREPHTEWVRNCVMMNWSVAHEFGLLTPENLELMRRGEPPRVTVGSFRGEPMEVFLQPVNDPRYKTAAAYPKFVPARMAKSMQFAAQSAPPPSPAPPPPRQQQRTFIKR